MAKKILDERLLGKLANKLEKSEKYIKEQISKKASKNRVSSEAYFVHWLSKEGIGFQNYRKKLSDHTLGEIHSLSKKDIKETPSTKKITGKKIDKILKINTVSIKSKSPLLTDNLIKDSIDNAELYPFLFLFENVLRILITKIMVKKYGDNWWVETIKNEIRDTVTSRMKKEKLNPWLGSRSNEPIYYADFEDLAKILRSKTNDFTPFFKDLVGGLNWLTQKIDELYLIRNNLAHACPLKSKDRNLLITYFTAFYDTLEILNSKI